MSVSKLMSAAFPAPQLQVDSSIGFAALSYRTTSLLLRKKSLQRMMFTGIVRFIVFFRSSKLLHQPTSPAECIKPANFSVIDRF